MLASLVSRFFSESDSISKISWIDSSTLLPHDACKKG